MEENFSEDMYVHLTSKKDQEVVDTFLGPNYQEHLKLGRLIEGCKDQMCKKCKHALGLPSGNTTANLILDTSKNLTNEELLVFRTRFENPEQVKDFTGEDLRNCFLQDATTFLHSMLDNYNIYKENGEFRALLSFQFVTGVMDSIANRKLEKIISKKKKNKEAITPEIEKHIKSHIVVHYFVHSKKRLDTLHKIAVDQDNEVKEYILGDIMVTPELFIKYPHLLSFLQPGKIAAMARCNVDFYNLFRKKRSELMDIPTVAYMKTDDNELMKFAFKNYVMDSIRDHGLVDFMFSNFSLSSDLREQLQEAFFQFDDIGYLNKEFVREHLKSPHINIAERYDNIHEYLSDLQKLRKLVMNHKGLQEFGILDTETTQHLREWEFSENGPGLLPKTYLEKGYVEIVGWKKYLQAVNPLRKK